jgi:hypothetical protein
VTSILKLRDGREIDLARLAPVERLYVSWLQVRIAAGEPYDAIAPAVLGPGAYPTLIGGLVEELARELIAGVRDAPRAARGEAAAAGILTVTEAAGRLGISRAAVIKAIREHRLPAFRFD